MSDGKHDWQPDPEQKGWEFCVDRGVRMSRPVTPVSFPMNNPGIPLAIGFRPVEFEIVNADKPFELPCDAGYEHLFAAPQPCHDPTEFRRKCAICGKCRYEKADGEILWGEPAEGGGWTMHHRWSLTPPVVSPTPRPEV